MAPNLRFIPAMVSQDKNHLYQTQAVFDSPIPPKKVTNPKQLEVIIQHKAVDQKRLDFGIAPRFFNPTRDQFNNKYEKQYQDKSQQEAKAQQLKEFTSMIRQVAEAQGLNEENHNGNEKKQKKSKNRMNLRQLEAQETVARQEKTRLVAPFFEFCQQLQ
ncbi:hypothetical protein FGO68_gene14212 [Halteria grandinella]|uniref:Uncharacterized protein n=1 Tax=Halteria grandinella TaxID=5974 RepID=A0A8J8T9V5_HALGN|nr:hypothetical protein FGO68_gene14212 [Halteria grandinella]